MDKLKNTVKNLIKNSDKNILALLGIAIVITYVMYWISDSFLSSSNINSMAFQFPEFGIMSFGMMLCMIAGGIDLSLVGTANLTGIAAAVVMVSMKGNPAGIIIGVILSLALGALCGLFNGYLIGQMKIPAMLVTLCGGQLYTGLAMVITKGPAITGLPESFQIIGNGTIAGILPYSLVIFIVVAIVINFVLKRTVFGKRLCFMGSNDTASKYAGINNLHVTLSTYMISGMLAAISGIIEISHYGSAKSDYGTSYTLLALLIVVFGGVDPAGGKGKVAGVTLAVVILQLISSAFNILRFDSFVKNVVWGLLLIVVMVVKSILQDHPINFGHSFKKLKSAK
ncbi:MAG TPA: ABC transporter permease [Ruminiclostridium sp.]|nr:ABC transporter permease [Ruminiclostridium sp.]